MLAYIAQIKTLDHLAVEGKSITDAGIAKLKDMDKLIMLGIHRTSVTDASIPVITGLPKLLAVSIHGTDIDPNKIRDANPRISVSY